MRVHLATKALAVSLMIGCSGDSGAVPGDNPAEEPAIVEQTCAIDASDEPTAGSDAGTVAKAAVLGNWPNWRGPAVDGISRGTNWTSKWPSDGPKTLWRKSIGIGFSSMSVANGRLYAMGHQQGQEYVYCLDAETGEQLWEHSYEGKLVKNLHEGGPCATPTVDDELVYTCGREGQLYCLSAKTGEPVWSKALQIELGVKLPAWGFTCSPVVLGGWLIVEAGRTVAFDKRTGELIWQTAKYRPGYGSPCIFDFDGDTLIAVLNNDYLMIVRAEDGTEIAKEAWETSYATNSTTPIVADGHVFISTGYNKGCAMFRFDGKQLELAYANKSMRNHFNNCVLYEGDLYGIDGNSNSGRNCKLVCMNWKTGDVKWEHRGLGCGSLLIADGKLIVLGDQGKLVVAEATDKQFNELSVSEVLQGRCWTVPVLAGGRIYCRNTPGVLVCLDVRE